MMPPESLESISQFSGRDKRYLPRWEVSNRILYQVQGDGQRKESLSHDLSCAGASILTEESITPNEKLQLTIYLDREVSVRVDGRVCWSVPVAKKHLIGINFEQTSRKAQDLILKYAFELDRAKLVRHWFKGWDTA